MEKYSVKCKHVGKLLIFYLFFLYYETAKLLFVMYSIFIILFYTKKVRCC